MTAGPTATAFAEGRATCLAAGMNDFIAKPVDPDAFAQVVQRWMDEACEGAVR